MVEKKSIKIEESNSNNQPEANTSQSETGNQTNMSAAGEKTVNTTRQSCPQQDEGWEG